MPASSAGVDLAFRALDDLADPPRSNLAPAPGASTGQADPNVIINDEN